MSTHNSVDSQSVSRADNPRRVVFMGTPAFVVPVFDALVMDPSVSVVAACVPPDRPRGRGRAMEAAPVKQRATELDTPVFQPGTLRNPEAVAELRAFAPDVIVVAAYGRILPTAVLNLPRFGCLNLHPSLLPAYRGPSPVVGALLAGDDTTGVTLMLMDEGMDTGPIIAQRTRVVAPHDDADSLTAALFSDGSDLLLQNLGDWMAGAVKPHPQDDARATYTTKIERADGAVDWELPAEVLARRRRAYAPWPGLYTRWEGKELKLLDVAAVTTTAVSPGLVVSADGAEISIGTGAGILTVNQLQLEGRRPATAAEFLRGYPQFVGAQLPGDGTGRQ